MKQYSKPFFLSDVMRMCRIPSGIIIKENIHTALRHNVRGFMKLRSINGNINRSKVNF